MNFSTSVMIILLKWIFLACMGFTTACHSGGGVTSEPEEIITSPTVLVPSIALPSTSPYYSNESIFVISGMCMNGNTVRLSGDAFDQIVCFNSTYTFVVNFNLDGIYAFVIDQVDALSHVSAAVSVIWVRQTSIPAPTILSPSLSPFASAQSILTLYGSCQTGATVSLSGDAISEQDCANSHFTFLIPKPLDGDYNIEIKQTDPAGNSASTTFIWNKHALTLSPSNPTLVVASTQLLTLSGGSGIYTLSLSTNNSGASIDNSTRTYTAGTIAQVTDVVQVTDSLGITASININTRASSADHFTLVSGNNQTRTIGEALTTEPKIRVTDRYGNGISNYQVYFQVIDGDAKITSPSSIQTTNASGEVSIALKMGFMSQKNSILARPLFGVLPDVTNSGYDTMTLTSNSSVNASGTAKFGLSFNTVTFPGALVLKNFGAAHQDNLHKDIAVINNSGNNISVHLNRGNGTYQTSFYTVCTGPSAITSNDFNGDSMNDLAVSCNSGQIGILIGNSDGTFQPLQTYVTTPGPLSIISGDFRKNGKVDLVVASSVYSNIAIHYGNGNGSFQSVTQLTEILDPPEFSPTQLKIFDINKDFAPDLLVLNGNGTDSISLLINKNDGSGTLHPKVDSLTGVGASQMCVGDFNKDSFDDVAITNSNDGSVSIFLNNQTSALSEKQDVYVGTGPSRIISADLQNANFKQDLIVFNESDGNLGILLNQTPSLETVVSFGAMSTLSFSNTPDSFAFDDTNGDGIFDLVGTLLSSPSSVEILPGLGGSSFGTFVTVGTNPVSGTIGKLITNSSQVQIVIANQNSNDITILTPTASGLLQMITSLPVGTAPVGTIIDDVNADSKGDILTINRGSSSISLYLGNGDGSFGSRVDLSTGLNPTDIKLIDLNHDSFMDLITTSTTTVSVHLGNGDGSFQQKVSYNVGINPLSLATSDFNGDGFVDVATVNAGDSTVSILIGNGDGTFMTQVTYGVGAYPNSIVAVDFNHDQIIDLAVLNNSDATVSIFSGVGDGSFTPRTTIIMGGTSLQKITFGDFHDQGHLDLVVTNGDNTFSTLRGRGDGSFDNPVTWSSSNYSTIYGGILTFDANQDGILDLLLMDSANNQTDIWVGQ